MKNRAQVSAEFIILFVLVLISFVTFLALTTARIAEFEEAKEEVIVHHLIENIRNEALLATQVHENYIRRFDLPLHINGNNYTIQLDRDNLYINITDGGHVLRNYYGSLPVSVKGNFISIIDSSTLDHCITKNSWDGIRIARNQVSVEFAGFDSDRDMHLDSDETWQGSLAPKLSRNDRFFVFFRVNCVENIRAVQSVIRYDSSRMRFIGISTVSRHDNNGPNPFYRTTKSYYYYPPMDSFNNNYNVHYTDPSAGRASYLTYSEFCEDGTGNLLLASFEVLAAASPGITKIGFDPDFTLPNDASLMIMDCNTNEFSSKGLPDSRLELFLEIA